MPWPVSVAERYTNIHGCRFFIREFRVGCECVYPSSNHKKKIRTTPRVCSGTPPVAMDCGEPAEDDETIAEDVVDEVVESGDDEGDSDWEIRLAAAEEMDDVRPRFVHNDHENSEANGTEKLQLPVPNGNLALEEPMLSGRRIIAKLLRNRGHECRGPEDLVTAGKLAVCFRNVFVLYYWTKIGVELVRDIIEQQQVSTRRFMLIVPGMSATAYRLCQTGGIEVIPPSLIRFDLMEHDMLPTSIVRLTPAEVRRVVKDPLNLPTIPTTDALCVYHAFGVGEFIQYQIDGMIKIRRVVSSTS